MKFAERLKEIRKQKRITQVELAKMCHVSQGTIANWEAGTRTPDLDTIGMIANLLAEAAETIAIRVTGDSMYPKIEDGDLIQVHKQDSVDSGSIAVMLLDGEEGFVKKVEYGPDWIELHSINPLYPVRRFEGEEVLRLRVVGLVKGVFHEF